MSDVQSNVKPLTLTTGRVIFAIAGVYVTQSLVSALSMQSLPALVRAAGGSLALAGATTLFMLPWALKLFGRRGSSAGGFRPVARNAVPAC